MVVLGAGAHGGWWVVLLGRRVVTVVTLHNEVVLSKRATPGQLLVLSLLCSQLALATPEVVSLQICAQARVDRRLPVVCRTANRTYSPRVPRHPHDRSRRAMDSDCSRETCVVSCPCGASGLRRASNEQAGPENSSANNESLFVFPKSRCFAT